MAADSGVGSSPIRLDINYCGGVNVNIKIVVEMLVYCYRYKQCCVQKRYCFKKKCESYIYKKFIVIFPIRVRYRVFKRYAGRPSLCIYTYLFVFSCPIMLIKTSKKTAKFGRAEPFIRYSKKNSVGKYRSNESHYMGSIRKRGPA